MSYYQYKSSNHFGRGKRPNAGRTGGRGPKKEYINPSKFIQSAKNVDTPDYVPAHNFVDFDINQTIKDNLVALGFETPSPIQDKTIPEGLLGKDVVGIADTGTGKTAAFAIPVINALMANREKNALILAPTRELALQIEEQCRKLGRNSGLKGAILIGGVAMGPQLGDLRNRPQIVIGTPGRIKDHSERGSLDLSSFNVIVLDEVDRMLDMGFINDIRFILEKTSNDRQSFYFSATLDERVKSIIAGFANDPTHIAVKTGNTSDNVEQNIVSYSGSNEKISKLHDLLIQEHVTKSLVFDDTHRSVEKLHKELESRGFEADAIHGGKSQAQRQRALQRFRDNKVNVLVATDVAARGLDVADISHVINFSTPQSYSDYVHRVGRAGRAGRKGYALTFLEK